MNTFNNKLKIFDNNIFIDEFVLANYSQDVISQTGILDNFNKIIQIIENTYIVNKIYNLMKNNSKNYKLKNKYQNNFIENENITYLYNFLVDINNDEYLKEVELFNKTRTKFLETYTEKILVDNEYFQPYEYLIFSDSKTFKKHYYNNDNFRGFIDKYYFSSSKSILTLENYKEYPILLELINNNYNYNYIIEKIEKNIYL